MHARRVLSKVRPLQQYHKTLRVQRRGFIAPSDTPDPPSLAILLSVLFGLPISLWAYKCLALVVFQRKLIYMGYLPPGARSERLGDLGIRETVPKGIICEESWIREDSAVEKDSKGTNQKVAALLLKQTTNLPNGETDGRSCVVMYLQGNAGNPLHRIPVFSRLLASISSSFRRAVPPSPFESSSLRQPSTRGIINTTILAPAPRSYWISSSRTPNQHGVTEDYVAALRIASSTGTEEQGRKMGNTGKLDPSVVLYGHSLGATVAMHVIASLANGLHPISTLKSNLTLLRNIQGLILENPFTSIPDMVRVLYGGGAWGRWMPYQYLARFVWDKWDVRSCLEDLQDGEGGDIEENEEWKRIRSSCKEEARRILSNALVLVSERDEVVPRWMGEQVWEVCQHVATTTTGLDPCTNDLRSKPEILKGRLVVIPRALHEDAWTKNEWVKAIGGYVREVVLERESSKRGDHL